MNPDNILHCIREGEGPVVVLSHALGCDITMWDGAAALLDKRYTLLAAHLSAVEQPVAFVELLTKFLESLPA